MTLLFDSTEIIKSVFWAIWVSAGFAVIFNAPIRAIITAGILGGIGFAIKSIFIQYIFIDQIILCTFLGASAVGLLGMNVAHYVKTPPIAFTIPAVINMIPGKYGYSFMLKLLYWVTSTDDNNEKMQYAVQTMDLGFKTLFILLALSAGIIIPILLFNVSTAKNARIIPKIRRR